MVDIDLSLAAAVGGAIALSSGVLGSLLERFRLAIPKTRLERIEKAIPYLELLQTTWQAIADNVITDEEWDQIEAAAPDAAKPQVQRMRQVMSLQQNLALALQATPPAGMTVTPITNHDPSD